MLTGAQLGANEKCDPLGIGTHGHAIANRLVDDAGCHVIGVDVAKPRVQSAADSQAASSTATGTITAASPGPSSAAPTSGLITVRACTSWSYWRMIHSLLHKLSVKAT